MFLIINTSKFLFGSLMFFMFSIFFYSVKQRIQIQFVNVALYLLKNLLIILKKYVWPLKTRAVTRTVNIL
jgi:hypothetical protein